LSLSPRLGDGHSIPWTTKSSNRNTHHAFRIRRTTRNPGSLIAQRADLLFVRDKRSNGSASAEKAEDGISNLRAFEQLPQGRF
jgi:hypothetical protein